MSIPLNFGLKYTPCNVDETYENIYFAINSVWPRDRLSEQWRIPLQLPKEYAQYVYISYSWRMVDKHLLSGFWCGRKSRLQVSDIAVVIECISVFNVAWQHVMVLRFWWNSLLGPLIFSSPRPEIFPAPRKRRCIWLSYGFSLALCIVFLFVWFFLLLLLFLFF